MSVQYVHTLIPQAEGFVPEPIQLANFLMQLTTLGAAPLAPKLRVGKLASQFRTGAQALSGEKISIPRRDFMVVEGPADLPAYLTALTDYTVIFEGQGPPKLRPFALYATTQTQDALTGERQTSIYEYTDAYSLEVECCLRPLPVSTSDWRDGRTAYSTSAGVIHFGDPFDSPDRTGVFHNPWTDALIEVPNAGSARFWIEFRFGKWLLPNIATHLDILAPAIVSCAQSSFAIAFAQGCNLR